MNKKIRIYDKDVLLKLMDKYHLLGYGYGINMDFEVPYSEVIINIKENFVPIFIGINGFHVIYYLYVNYNQKKFSLRGTHITIEQLRKDKIDKLCQKLKKY